MTLSALDPPTLAELGWSAPFQAACDAQDLDPGDAVRVMAVHREQLEVAGPRFAGRVPSPRPLTADADLPTVGDWLVLDVARLRAPVLLPRTSLIRRRSAGREARIQAIAANLDTVLLVTSANLDFNLARLERYLALAREAGVTPVVVLTKADLAGDPAPFVAQARSLDADLAVVAVDAREPDLVALLGPWLGRGRTLALLGSSGVGKSTIVNTLIGHAAQATQGIREDDARGRHTTTGRSMHRIAGGAWLIDTPGMREVQVVEAAGGIEAVFDDIAGLAADCRFADCRHAGEPGCAVAAAIAAGTLAPERLARFRKLHAEDRHNSEAAHEARARSRAFGRMVRGAMAAKERRGRDG